MKCESCGAPIENGRCTYCGKLYNDPLYMEKTLEKIKYVKPVSVSSGTHYKKQINAKTETKKKMSIGKKILIFFIFCLFVSMCSNTKKSSSSNATEDATIWATEETSIGNFDYYLDSGKVYLKEYTGKDKNVKIANSYIIDGKEYEIGETINDLFSSKKVNSVILPEGITSMPNNTFANSKVKYLYIPESLKEIKGSYSFYKYFHDVEKIYYGGTEEEWTTLTDSAERADIDATEIIYNANIEDLK